MTPGLLKSLCAWRARWSSLAFTIVLGNHDRGAESVLFGLRLRLRRRARLDRRHRVPAPPDRARQRLRASRSCGTPPSGRPPERAGARFASHALFRDGRATDRAARFWRVCRRLAGDSRRRRAGADRDGSGRVRRDARPRRPSEASRLSDRKDSIRRKLKIRLRSGGSVRMRPTIAVMIAEQRDASTGLVFPPTHVGGRDKGESCQRLRLLSASSAQ